MTFDETGTYRAAVPEVTATSAPPAFSGSPRDPVTPLLDRAAEAGIRQLLDRDGRLLGDVDPAVDRATARRMYRTMVAVRLLDERGWELQRAGRVEFWIPSRGQEASHVASTAALEPSDWVFLADREPGTMLWRGASFEAIFSQVFGRFDEPLQGRRLPLLFGDRSRNVLPCTTQVGAYIPHAAGAAWAARLRGDDTRFIVYFGDGATSRGEFHSTLNFAGIHKPPIILFCQNNGWAVSTPTDRQTASETFAGKAPSYGVEGVRVDGNDFLAVHEVTREAREAAPERGATLVEAVTYRLGFHTSSDNPDLYRDRSELEAWAEWDPIKRARGFLTHYDGWTDDEDDAMVAALREEIRAAIHVAEAKPLPQPADQFDHVFAEVPTHLAEQRAQLLADLAPASQEDRS